MFPPPVLMTPSLYVYNSPHEAFSLCRSCSKVANPACKQYSLWSKLLISLFISPIDFESGQFISQYSSINRSIGYWLMYGSCLPQPKYATIFLQHLPMLAFNFWHFVLPCRAISILSSIPWAIISLYSSYLCSTINSIWQSGLTLAFLLKIESRFSSTSPTSAPTG